MDTQGVASTPKAMRSTPGAMPLSFVVLAFQAMSKRASWDTSSLGRSGRGTGADHDEGEFSSGGARDHGARRVALSSLAISISVGDRGVPASHPIALNRPCNMRLFQGNSSHFVPFCPIHFYLFEAGYRPDGSDGRAHHADGGFLQIVLGRGARCATTARRANRGEKGAIYTGVRMLERPRITATYCHFFEVCGDCFAWAVSSAS